MAVQLIHFLFTEASLDMRVAFRKAFLTKGNWGKRSMYATRAALKINSKKCNGEMKRVKFLVQPYSVCRGSHERCTTITVYSHVFNNTATLCMLESS